MKTKIKMTPRERAVLAKHRKMRGLGAGRVSGVLVGGPFAGLQWVYHEGNYTLPFTLAGHTGRYESGVWKVVDTV